MALRLRKDIKKSSYYVWFLGAKESKGLRGSEYVLPVIQHLIEREKDVEPFKVTLQVSHKGLKIIQNVVTQGSKGSKPKNETIKHFIPHNTITCVYQQEDIIACILLLFNPVTKCPLHVHAYRCDSLETAVLLKQQLQILIERPENQKKFGEIESRLKTAPSVKEERKKKIDSSLGSDTGTSTRESESSEERFSCNDTNTRVATLYDSVAAELRAKLNKNDVPILLPPRDYDTVHRQKGNLTGIELRRCLNSNIVGQNAKTNRRIIESSGGSSGIGSDHAPSPDSPDSPDARFNTIDNQSTSDEDWNAEAADSTLYLMSGPAEVTLPRPSTHADKYKEPKERFPRYEDTKREDEKYHDKHLNKFLFTERRPRSRSKSVEREQFFDERRYEEKKDKLRHYPEPDFDDWRRERPSRRDFDDTFRTRYDREEERHRMRYEEPKYYDDEPPVPKTRQKYPEDRQKYPEDRQKYPEERQKYPEERQKYPDERQKYPEERQKYPEERQKYTEERQNKYPEERQKYPDESKYYHDSSRYQENGRYFKEGAKSMDRSKKMDDARYFGEKKGSRSESGIERYSIHSDRDSMDKSSRSKYSHDEYIVELEPTKKRPELRQRSPSPEDLSPRDRFKGAKEKFLLLERERLEEQERLKKEAPISPTRTERHFMKRHESMLYPKDRYYDYKERYYEERYDDRPEPAPRDVRYRKDVPLERYRSDKYDPKRHSMFSLIEEEHRKNSSEIAKELKRRSYMENPEEYYKERDRSFAELPESDRYASIDRDDYYAKSELDKVGEMKFLKNQKKNGAGYRHSYAEPKVKLDKSKKHFAEMLHRTNSTVSNSGRVGLASVHPY